MQNKKLRVCVITGTRAEYGLLKHLMKALQHDDCFELQVIATCMHLSPEFGNTYQEIEQDGFNINKKIEILLSSDTEIGICKSMGLANIGFADAYSEMQPNLIVVLGDRFEILSAVSTALIFKIPVAHLHGGETTKGAFDEGIRHAITKMSHIHFSANDEFSKRIIQLGENPKNVFTVGGLGIDAIKKINLLTKSEFEKSIQRKLFQNNLLITFHPVTLEKNTARIQFENLLKALDRLDNTLLIFTKPNADTDGRIIVELIDEYVKKNSYKSISFTSLGQLKYFSALQFMNAVVGNSSSGLLEVPSFKIPTLNIGDRQKGRLKASSVIDCSEDVESISNGLQKIFSKDFIEKSQSTINPYGEGGAVNQIIAILKTIDLTNIIKKHFYDL